MINLDPKLAQQIVERTTRIINCHINVMDPKGIIIASSDKSRINERHDGAILALSHNVTIEIDNVMAKGLLGTRPGINLLLEYKGRTLGVVGITGEPEKVRNYGLLVKMCAELLIEQRVLLNENILEDAYKKNLLTMLLNDNKPLQAQSDLIQSLGLSIDQPYRVLVWSAHITRSSAHISELAKTIKLHPVYGRFSYHHELRIITLLEDKNFHHDEIQRYLHWLANSGWQVKLGVGMVSNQLGWSYQSALDSLIMGQKLQPQQHCYYSHEWLLSGLITPQKGSWQQALLFDWWQKLVASTNSGSLIKTMAAYFVHKGDKQKTSEQLHIHINTLRYRLEKIEQVTGLHFHIPHEYMLLYSLWLTFTDK